MENRAEELSGSIPETLISSLQHKVGSLQMLPAVALQALQVAQDPECDLARLSTVIERDLKLATFILRIANSALMSSGAPVSSLHQGVARLGLRHCRHFILTAGLDALSKHMGAQLAAQRKLLWGHGFLTAIFAVEISRMLDLDMHGEEFTAGLLHDLGRTLLAVASPTDFQAVDRLDFVEPADQEDQERRWIGAAHTDFGAWFLEWNEVPEELVAAVRYHHRPAEAQAHQRLAAVIAAADQMANFVHRTTDGSAYDPASNTAIPLLEQQGVPGARSRFDRFASRLLGECPSAAAEIAG